MKGVVDNMMINAPDDVKRGKSQKNNKLNQSFSLKNINRYQKKDAGSY
jgi:hypothetical protein